MPGKTSGATQSKRLLTEEELLAMPPSEYMNAEQLDFFRLRLEALEQDLLANADSTVDSLRTAEVQADLNDRATIEEEHGFELRTRDREYKLLRKVREAIGRIESGEYGWCQETGEAIGIPRLLARPASNLTLDAQERHEQQKKLYGD